LKFRGYFKRPPIRRAINGNNGTKYRGPHAIAPLQDLDSPFTSRVPKYSQSTTKIYTVKKLKLGF
jgi:hypothetical protein